jgi:hypothetical protein
MLITSFQGFQTKPVTAQALFQCIQDHEEYLQAYVRRFLRLRAQAPTVPNEKVSSLVSSFTKKKITLFEKEILFSANTKQTREEDRMCHKRCL